MGVPVFFRISLNGGNVLLRRKQRIPEEPSLAFSHHTKNYKLCNSGSGVSSEMYTVKETCTAYHITQNLIKHCTQY